MNEGCKFNLICGIYILEAVFYVELKMFPKNRQHPSGYVCIDWNKIAPYIRYQWAETVRFYRKNRGPTALRLLAQS